MLFRVLNVRHPSDLALSHVETLIADAVQENQHLEYISELPGGDRMKEDFAEKVASIANGGGGIIVYGVLDDERNAAAKLTPVPLQDAGSKLRQIAAARVEPFLRIQVHELATDTDAGCVVVEIPDSHRRPFAVNKNRQLRFWTRAGSERVPMSEAEVERMYRDRFSTSETVVRRLDNLVASVVDPAINQYDTTIAYVAGVPTTRPERLFSLDRQTVIAVRETDWGPPTFGNHRLGSPVPPGVGIGFKRLIWHKGNPGDPRVVEFHDDGAFLAVVRGSKLEVPTFVFRTRSLTAGLLARLGAYGVLARDFGIRGELMLAVGIADANLPAVLIGGDFHEGDFDRQLRQPVQTIRTVDSERLVPGPTLLEEAKPLLDDIFSAFDWPGCGHLRDDGTLVRQSFGRDVQTVAAWAAQLGIELA